MGRTISLITLFILCTHQIKAQIYIDTFGKTVVHIKTLLDSSYFNKTTNPSGVSGAWDLYWGHDNKLWFSNNSRVERLDPATGKTRTLLTIPNSYLLGITAHSDFVLNPYVYLVVDTGVSYYASVAGFSVLYRYKYDVIKDSLVEPKFILSWYHVAEHLGGRMIFGQDKKLYVSTSEYYFGDDSLFYNSGKILRVNPDGTVPIDNPKADYTFSYGHRVPQGIVQLPLGNIISAEYGHNNDELNLIKKGKNYGWNFAAGYTFDGFFPPLSPTDSAIWMPKLTFPIDVGENPPSGIDYYDHKAIPEFKGIIEAVTGVRNGNGYWCQGIIAYGLNSRQDSVVSKKRYMGSKIDDRYSAFGRIRDVCTSPDGKVYFIGGDRSKTPTINVIYNPKYLSVEENRLENSALIYPNPTTGIIYLSFQRFDKKETEYEVFNLLGERIKQGKIETNGTKIDISEQPEGWYLVKISGEKNNFYKVLKINSEK